MNAIEPISKETKVTNEGIISTQEIIVAYETKPVLKNVSVSISKGEITAIVGPNGSGKSTLLKTIARLIPQKSGHVFLHGEDMKKMKHREVAKKLAILPQSPSIPSGTTVLELVEQGRYPYTGPLKVLNKKDHDMIDRALTLTHTENFRNRSLENLSGGEKQRVWLALALTQDTPVLLLDEPTTFLDISHQLEILQLIEELNKTQALTIIIVLHDLNHAVHYSHRMIIIDDGKIIDDGVPEKVLTEKILRDVFRVEGTITVEPITGRFLCIPVNPIKE